MATWSQAEWVQASLERLGIVGAGEAPSAEDTDLVTEVSDSLYPQLRTEGLAPFAVSAISEWAQQPFAKLLAYEAKDYFGITGQRAQILAAGAVEGRRELSRQMQGGRRNLRVKAKFY